MSYSVDLRQRVVKFVEEGGAKAEAARRFSVSEGSVHNWLKRDDLAPTRVKRRHRKLDWKALEQHVQDEPDAKLIDRAEHFGVHTTAIWYAIKQMNITRKSGATPLGFPQHGNAHQDKTAKVSRAQSSRATRVSSAATTGCSTTQKPELDLQDANLVSTTVSIKTTVTPNVAKSFTVRGQEKEQQEKISSPPDEIENY